MNKRKLVSLVVMGSVIAANACYIPDLIKTDTWVDGSYTHDYKVFQYIPGSPGIEKTWNATETWVEANYSGWKLASVTSAAEQANLTDFMSGTSGEYWLGGYRNNSGWSWINGDPWSNTYSNWGPGEPNNTGSNENYMGTWSNMGWKWNDEGNLCNITGFIAERTIPVSVPEPASIGFLGFGLLSLLGISFRKRDAR